MIFARAHQARAWGAAALLVAHAQTASALDAATQTAPDATVHVSAFDLPLSDLLSPESRAVLKRQAGEMKALREQCRYFADGPRSASRRILDYRRCYDDRYFRPLLERQMSRYKVAIRSETIAGIPTEVITPLAGIPSANRNRVLINLHGGGFIMGGGWGARAESIPIAAQGRFKVIAVDYRMAPEHRFPAASEDVAAVYRTLLKDHRPQDIGIYGCSAGGLLTAEVVAWLQKEQLASPGAVGMFGAGAYWSAANDSFRLFLASDMLDLKSPQPPSYLVEADRASPLAIPGPFPEVMAKFPPSLFISATRDPSLSTAVATHAQLLKLGVAAELYVGEGLGHCFFTEPDLPESRDAYEVIVRFFDRHLGVRPAP
jgi:epsilon-lactone hydrolase